MLKVKWNLGYKDRGLGHIDYSVMIVNKGDVIIIECPNLEVAEHITKLHNESMGKEV